MKLEEEEEEDSHLSCFFQPINITPLLSNTLPVLVTISYAATDRLFRHMDESLKFLLKFRLRIKHANHDIMKQKIRS